MRKNFPFPFRSLVQRRTEKMRAIWCLLFVCLFLQSCVAFVMPPGLAVSMSKVHRQRQHSGFVAARTALLRPSRKFELAAGYPPRRNVGAKGKGKKFTPPATAAAAAPSDGAPERKLKEDVIEMQGRVTDALPGGTFRVQMEPTGSLILCVISGKIRKNNVKVLVGDYVRVELSIFDLTRGRITFRMKNERQ